MLSNYQDLTEKYNGIICDIDEQFMVCRREQEPLQDEYELLSSILDRQDKDFTEEEKEVMQNDLSELKSALDYLEREMHNLMAARGYYLKTNSFIGSFMLTDAG